MFRVLVVEDEFWMCEGLKKMVRHLDINFIVTDVAHNGKEALEKMEEQTFDLLFADINMPIMDGLQMMDEMENLKYNVPVIIITGFDEFEYARKALRYGAVDYLLKPIKNDELREVLEHWELEHKKQYSLSNNEPKSLEFNNSGADLIQSILQLVETNYMKDLSLSILADQAGYNASYLSRLFKVETGKGFVQYLRDIRMKHACYLLINSKLTIEHISQKVGFLDEKHFRRTFKKDLGMTPGEYRKIYGK
ncbi:response regulator [Halalkalibacter sp. AB-rgal2]|uniref:response regulator transcription factor n=1 Tax=Halalkalibacter sp. AB-rgal2 TaxID=3242695 RepID=UPI00359D2F25